MSNLSYCRLCGLEFPLPYIKTLEQVKNENLDTIIYHCLKINLNLNDVLPKTTCYNCCGSVLEYHNFINKVQNVQIKLSEIFKKNTLDVTNIKTETNVDEPRGFIDVPIFSNVDDKAPKKLEINILSDKSLFQSNEVKSEINDLLKTGSSTTPSKEDEINKKEAEPAEERPIIKKERTRAVVTKPKPCLKCARCVCGIKKTKSGKKRRGRKVQVIVQYDCDKCGKSFKKRSRLREHHFTHTDEKPVKCDTCGKGFKHDKALKAHSIKHLPTEKKYRFKCETCSRMFITSSALTLHKKIHAGIYGYVCELCGAKHRTPNSLAAHRLTHQSDTPFHCTLCTKQFKTKDACKRHQIVHSDLKPHSCNICGQSFKVKKSLKQHMKSHSTDLPFECSYCKKRFRDKGFLTAHMRQHTGERPYSCKECNHQFTNASNYKKHMQGRHGETVSTAASALRSGTDQNRVQQLGTGPSRVQQPGTSQSHVQQPGPSQSRVQQPVTGQSRVPHPGQVQGRPDQYHPFGQMQCDVFPVLTSLNFS